MLWNSAERKPIAFTFRLANNDFTPSPAYAGASSSLPLDGQRQLFSSFSHRGGRGFRHNRLVAVWGDAVPEHLGFQLADALLGGGFALLGGGGMLQCGEAFIFGFLGAA